MLKLKRLELLGFKSFADRTRVEFPEGTVAIVGPNGCGKSNLSDAISWVLGEQSPRLLRGERMVDVIFNGTGSRLPTNLAEVSMTLFDPEAEEAEASPFLPEPGSNGDGMSALPGAGTPGGNGASERKKFSQVTVTRRLFRPDESEYLINGEAARLRDIQDLFMGTGLGPESYAIIEQGRIGQILSSKPSDRRLILEEAAGISKFKARKRAAELKLESARGNLSRITDILLEVSKQVNSLKRQAAKARRYKELRGELQVRQRAVLASRLKALETAQAQLKQELTGLEASVAEAAERLAALEREQKTATARGEQLERKAQETQEAMTRAALERQRIESRIEQAGQESAHLEARSAEAREETAQREARRASVQTESGEQRRAREELEEKLRGAREHDARLLGEQQDSSLRIGEAEAALERARQALLASLSEAAELGNQLTQAEEMAIALERQASRAAAERAAAGEEKGRATAELENAAHEHLHGEREQAGLEESLGQVASALEAARQREATERQQLEALRQEASAVLARRQTLEAALASHAYTPEGVRRLLAGEIKQNGHRFHPMGLLADFLEVSSGYEEVVEEFLKAELGCIVVEGHEEARSGIALLRAEGAGRSMFFVRQAGASGHSNGHDDPARREAGVVAAVRDLVRFEPRLGLNGDPPLPALAKAYVVEGAATAERLALAYPEHHFLTATGEHYHYRLVSGGKGASSGPLGLRRDLRELERRATELESAVRAAEADLAEAVAVLSERDEAWKRLTAKKVDAEKRVLLASEKIRQARERLQQAEDRLALAERETAGLASERQGIETRRAELRGRLDGVAAERQRREESIRRLEQELRAARASAEQLARGQAQAMAQVSGLEERAQSAAAECERLTAEAQEIERHLARLCGQKRAWEQRRCELGEETALARERLVGFEGEQRAMQEALNQVNEALKTARARRDELAPLLEALRGELEAVRQKRSETEVAQARAESDYGHLAQECRETLQTDPEALLAGLALEALLSGEALEEAARQASELKAKIEGLGPLNMMALEELQEAEERYQFLETQRQDLLTSIEDTVKAIREIDQVSRQQFLEAFRKINTYFAESFRTLFGGGVGELRLADENDPESGLDIVAQPPGKRLQNILLLSGGEKALAALALLIALFRYTPSPFCILDEVDAPLDESNIERFTRMLESLSSHTQFIIITHNKRTMETAQTIYGVTMEEPGVTKLVSVKFSEAEAEPVAVPA